MLYFALMSQYGLKKKKLLKYKKWEIEIKTILGIKCYETRTKEVLV